MSEEIYSLLSIACIIIFIVLFAISLGPVPFIYTAECFRQNERDSAMAVCIFANWSSALLVTLVFPIVQGILQQNVFVVFIATVLVGFIIVVFKVHT